MRFSSKTFKKRASRKGKKSRKSRKSKTIKQRGGWPGSSLYRNIPKEAVVVNPMQWDDPHQQDL